MKAVLNLTIRWDIWLLKLFRAKGHWAEIYDFHVFFHGGQEFRVVAHSEESIPHGGP